MSDDSVRLHFQVIRQRITALQREDAEAWREIDATLEDLQVICEQMQTNLEATEVIQDNLLYYRDLFASCPIAYLVTNTDGVILEANRAIARLLNIPECYLVGNPLAMYVAEGDRSTFVTQLNQLDQSRGSQVWQMNLCPRDGQAFASQWHIAIARNLDGLIESLRIGVYKLSPSQQVVSPIQPSESRFAPLAGQQSLETIPKEGRIPLSPLPHSLDCLRVLVVDDEADIREFITTVFESYGIDVKTVASAAAALEELEQFHPDVLVSDIRMPGVDGYSLIRRIRALEAGQGGHIPAVALTAYLDEDREKALLAGYEAHLHKLTPPTKWIEMVSQLVGQASDSDRDKQV
ncbi:response regulator [Aliterella atlantica]|uniref:PAS/PAC sensor protein n=1 Tax=Aliterella atlantica CENA595 TaxID=1618023 RepID=A0A0D9A1K1_9CYAN|nr:response regulator [Aliterella atlantica]KJH73336.1 PAS/PAC sensor protein [Aliterella atlantica CENA595]